MRKRRSTVRAHEVAQRAFLGLFIWGLALPFPTALQADSPNFKYTRSSLNSSGERKTTPSFTLDFSIGEVARTTHTFASRILRSGLQTIYHYPGRINDLSCSSSTTNGEVSLQWTAPGNDGQDSGTRARAYLVRHSSVPSQSPAVSDELFNAAVSATPAPPTPATQGTVQTMTVQGLIAAATYYFAIKALEADGVPGVLSVGCTIPAGIDIWPPEPIANLAASAPAVEGQVALTWTAPFEDSGIPPKPGPVASYTVRLATFSADSVASTTTWWNQAQDVAGEPAPKAPGGAESMTISALEPSVTHYFAIKSRDVAGNDSPIDTASELGVPPQAQAVVFDAAPPAPQNLQLAGLTFSSATVAWDAVAAPDLDFYRVHIDSTPPFDFVDKFVLAVDSPTTSFVHAGLIQGATYSFFVTVVDKGVPAFAGAALESPSSNVLTVVVPVLGPVSLVGAAADAPGRKVSLSWSNPNPEPKFALVLRQAGSPPGSAPSRNVPYNVGDLLGGATVVYNAQANSFTDGGLALDTTWYYTLFARTPSHDYAAGVSTSILVDLKPLFVAGLNRTLAPDKSQVTVRWSSVPAEEDGTAFADPGAPLPHELMGYRLYRSTSPWSPPALVVTLAPSATAYTDPIGGTDYYYHLRAFDKYNQESETSLKVQAFTGDILAASADRRHQVRIGNAAVGYLNGGNPHGENIHIAAQFRPQEVGGKILESVEFVALKGGKGEPVGGLRFPEPQVWVSFYYKAAGTKVSFSPQAAASLAEEDLGLYWHNGSSWVKLYGDVNPADQSITVRTSWLGPYQVRSVLRARQFTFDTSGILNRFITPNGDGKNDTVVFMFQNAADAAVTGKIFDVRGAFVSEMRAPMNLGCGLQNECLEWDGKSNGQRVPVGVYIYQLQGERKVFNGTVIVIR